MLQYRINSEGEQMNNDSRYFEVPLMSTGQALIFTCTKCRGKINQAHETVYADSQGEPFEDYVHGNCREPEHAAG